MSFPLSSLGVSELLFILLEMRPVHFVYPENKHQRLKGFWSIVLSSLD